MSPEHREVTASTRVVTVIGDPIRHSLSPVIHNAAFRALDMDWICVALPVREGGAAGAVAGMRALDLRGMSVTMPHKSAVIPALDRTTDRAALLDSVNCVLWDGDQLVGDSTDGEGFLAGLRDDFDLDPAGRSCVVLGAGGAARAVVLALAGAGAASVRVVNRTAERAARAAALAGSVGAVGAPADVAGADLVVNATPVGMARPGHETPSSPVAADQLHADQVVAELIYHPATTPLMRVAQDAGARTSNGLSMLVHQAAVAFRSWTGEDAPVPAMAAAARAALDETG